MVKVRDILLGVALVAAFVVGYTTSSKGSEVNVGDNGYSQIICQQDRLPDLAKFAQEVSVSNSPDIWIAMLQTSCMVAPVPLPVTVERVIEAGLDKDGDKILILYFRGGGGAIHFVEGQKV